MTDRAESSGELAEQLIELVHAELTLLARHHAPDLQLPRAFAGHPVGADTTADLIYVLGLLVECGVTDVEGVMPAERAIELIESLDADRVEAFASYRVGETALRLDGALPASLVEHTIACVQTPETLRMLDNGRDIPPNFAVVAARCLLAESRLRVDAPSDPLDAYVDRVRSMFASSSTGWLDDGMGDLVHYDIYTPDMYLFAEPLIELLGGTWEQGLDRVLADLDDLAHPGGAVVWGRSVGALGLAMTIELAGMAAGRGRGVHPGPWLARATETTVRLRGWFNHGLIRAHQHRSTMFYRGPARRLQMTLDVLGKLLLAAIDLRRRPDVAASSPAEAWPYVDRLVDFSPADRAGAWVHRSKSLSFVLPMMLGWSSDYLPSPRGPGLFEQPTSGPATGIPVVFRGPVSLLPAGLPTSAELDDTGLTLSHDGFAPVGAAADHDDAIGGSRVARLRVEGRSLVVDEHLRVDDPDLVDTIALAIGTRPGRPVDVEVDAGDETNCRMQTIDTSGIAEWRSFWGPIPKVHQIECEPAAEVRFTWRVRPQLRVVSTIHGHQYDNALYEPIADRLVARAAPPPGDDVLRQVRDAEIFHMAWPEWWSGVDPDLTTEMIAAIKHAGTRIVWTQHNLLPHYFKSDESAVCYQLWAAAADAVIHHTEWGMNEARSVYEYGPDTIHEVIPHGHWGHQYAPRTRDSRAMVELEEGWPQCAIRLAVVGSPREEKLLQLAVDAVAECDRDDIQLVIRLDHGVAVPDDPRIIAEMGHVEESRYLRRMNGYDALVMPFAPTGMLTTGTAFDAIGRGVATITSAWEFFDEAFGGGDIRYGTTTGDLRHCIENLSVDALASSAEAMIALQPRYDWTAIADRTLDLFERVAEAS